jgi:adenylate kinase
MNDFALEIQDKNARVESLKDILKKLPKENQRLLHALLSHFINVFRNQEHNKVLN